MQKHRVFIIWSNPLFYEAIRLLLDHPDITIVGDSASIDDANKEITELHPDLVIIESSGEGEGPNDETLFILRAGPKVIRLSLADNELKLYQRQEKTINRPDELLNIILGDSSEEHPV